MMVKFSRDKPNPIAVRRHIDLSRTTLLATVSAFTLLAHAAPAHARPLFSSSSGNSGAAQAAQAAAIQAAQQQAAAAQNSQAAMSRAVTALRAVQTMQAAAHAAVLSTPIAVPDGLAPGGLVPAVSAPRAYTQDPTGVKTWDGANMPTQSVSASSAVNVNIRQSQPQAILSWDSFNVGRNTTLTFDQQGNVNWVALNRVVAGTAPSQILGNIKADGTVLVINQNGIIFGGGSQINVGSLIASSLDVGARPSQSTIADTYLARNQAFMQEGLIGTAQTSFSALAGAADSGAVQVQEGASITTNGSGGLILMMAPQIVNDGYLFAPVGQVALAAGNSVALAPATGAAGSVDPNVRGLFVTAGLVFPVGQPDYGNTIDSYIWNQPHGLIEADQGNITLTTYGASSFGINNNGVIVNAPVAGGSVRNDGVLWSTTSVSRNGSILVSGANIQLSTGSVIAIPPDSNGDTIPQDPTSLAGFKTSEIVIGSSGNAANIDMQSGAYLYAPSANVTIGSPGGLDPNQSNNVSTIVIDNGAVIDVAGLADVEVPASRNEVVISPVKGNELADSPLYRDGFLNGATVYLDPRLSGVRADGVAWIGSPLIDATAYYQLVGVGAAELMTKGGNVTIGNASVTGGLTAVSPSNASSVLIKAGAVIDFAGGWVTYQAGTIRQTELISATGNIVPIGEADPNTVYVGIYNGFTVNHPRWGVTEIYSNPLKSDSYYQSAYTEGRDAGWLALSSDIVIPDGTFYGQAFAGSKQIADSQIGTGKSTLAGDLRAIQGANSQLPAGGFISIGGQGNLVLTDNAPVLSDAVGLGEMIATAPNGTLSAPAPGAGSLVTLPIDFALNTSVSAGLIGNAGLSQLSLNAAGTLLVAPGVNLALNAGGVFSATAQSITVAGAVSAPSGKINLTTTSGNGSIFAPAWGTLGSYDINILGELSVAGRWVNNFGTTAKDYQTTAWSNGGSIALFAASDVLAYFDGTTEVSSLDATTTSTAVDISGSIYINSGSKLDLASGGAVDPKGNLTLTAKGGNLALEIDTAYFPTVEWQGTSSTNAPGFRVVDIGTFGATTTAVNPAQINARIVIDPAAIEAQGFGGGGTFTLVTPQVDFGRGTPAAGTLLPMNFFSTAGFANYDIVSYKTALLPSTFTNGLGGYNSLLATQTLTVGAGQTLALTQSVLPTLLTQAQGVALLNLASGGDVLSVVAPLVPGDAWDQKAVNLNLGGLIELHVAQGGSIIGSAGGSITTAKLYNEGKIRIPGGTITQQEVLPGLYESVLATESTSNLAIGVHSLSDIFSTNPDGTIDPNAPNAMGITSTATSNPTTQVLTNAQIAGDWFDGDLHAIYLLGLLGQNQGVVLAPGSATDLSGTSIVNPRAVGTGGQAITSGTIVAGGSIVSVASVNAISTTMFPTSAVGLTNPDLAIMPETIVAQPGSTINLSGASGAFDMLSTGGGRVLQRQSGYVSTPVWSDAGSLIAMNGATLTGAIINANGGTAAANGGTLELLNPVLTQTDPVAPTANVISASQIEGAGFDTFVAVGSIGSSGNAKLQLRRGFFLEGAGFDAYLPNGTISTVSLTSTGNLTPVVSAGGALEIDAPYISLVSTIDQLTNSSVEAGAGSVLFKADDIDITGAVIFDQSVANATLQASGDIRLTGVQQYQVSYVSGYLPSTSTLDGGLVANGNLSIVAGQVYPSTGSTFTISSTAANGTISFARSGTSVPATPYSAGGNLGVYAANIVQDGIVRVPFGMLTLGSNTSFTSQVNGVAVAFAPATQSVTLGADSITGVSADGLNIPYGITTDQIEWYFAPTSAAALTAPPAKIMNINASSISMAAGATVDLTGGGDVYAYEFVPGTGGSRDVLSRTSTAQYSSDNGYQYPDARQIYAIVPGLSNPVAAYDPIYSSGYSNLYSASAAGEQVYLSAATGLAAGWYTLLPAQYAMLPGGMRVVVQSGATNVVPGTAIQNPDGSLLVAGHYGNALSNTSSSTNLLFSVESQAVIEQNSNIVLSTGTALTIAADTRNNITVAPRIAADAGQLVLNPLASLDLETSLSAAAAAGGRGAEVDIGGLNIDILSSLSGAPRDGAIHVTATSLTNLSAASLLIGGTRTDNSDGTTTLNVTAQSILVENDAAHPLSAAEIVLAVDDLTSNSVASTLTLADGASVVATGTLSDQRSGDYIINANVVLVPAQNNGVYNTVYPADTGTGAVFRVANGVQRLVDRQTDAATPTVPAATLSVGNITAQGTSISLDTSNNATFGASAVLKAHNIALGAHALAFTSSVQPADTIVVTPVLQALLSQADSLVLHAQTTIGFDNGTYQLGATTLDAEALAGLQGGTVNISAGALGLGNSGSGTAAASDGTGILNISANAVSFGSGTLVTQGFGGGVNITAAQGVFAGGTAGVLDTGNANLTVTTPWLGDQAITGGQTEQAYQLTLTTAGNVAITNAGMSDLSSLPAGVPGSALTIAGNNIAISGTIVNATAGSLAVNAAGTITLANGAVLQAPGYSRVFGDAVDPVTRSSPGGSVTLAAQGTGGIALGNATLSVGGGTGNAGTLTLATPNGAIDFGTATMNGTGGPGGAGGIFALTTQGAVDLVGLNNTVGADGFTGGFSLTTQTGDIVLAANQILRSGSVLLDADGGLVNIFGTIDTSGVNGGNISLYGVRGVTLQSGSKLNATATGYGAADTRQATGGSVTIGTDYYGATTTDTTTGVVSGNSGTITVAAGAIINVSATNPQTSAAILAASVDKNGNLLDPGGIRLVPMLENGTTYYEVAQGDQGGTVTFRAPVEVIATGPTTTAETVNISIANAKTSIIGASAISVQGFRRWDLAAVAASGNFTGVTNDAGTITLDVTAGLDTINADGTTTPVAGLNFLGDNGPGTLVDFVQKFNISADYDNLGGLASLPTFTANPGIDLTASGKIVLASNWNLGAGIVNQTAALAAGLMSIDPISGQAYVVSGDEGALLANYTTMFYRVGGSPTGAAPVISLRAGGDLHLEGSITDGFFEYRDQLDTAAQSAVPTPVQEYINNIATLYLSLFGDGSYFESYSTYIADPNSYWDAFNIFDAGVPPSIGTGTSTTPNTLNSLAAQSAAAGQLLYNAAGNSPAALGSGSGGISDTVGSAVVFPLLPGGKVVASSTYNLTAGAALKSANPLATVAGDTGSLIVDAVKSVTETSPAPIVTDTFLINGGANDPGFAPGQAGFDTYLESLYPGLTGDTDVELVYATIPPALAAFAKAHAGDGTVTTQDFGNGVETDMSLSTFAQFVQFYAAQLVPSWPVPPPPTTTTTILSPRIVVRTGTGSINMSAAGKVDLTGGAPIWVDNTGTVISAPATPGFDGSPVYQMGGPAIYTIGHIAVPLAETVTDPNTGVSVTLTPQSLLPASLFSDAQSAVVQQYESDTAPGVLLTDPVYLEGGGNITVSAGSDVLGRSDTGALAAAINYNFNNTRVLYSFIGSLDTPWYVGQIGAVASAAINPQLFTSGLGALGGGSIAVRASGNVTDVTAVADSSLATATVTSSAGSSTSALLTMGSGNVTINAVGNISGGRIDVASGAARIAAGGSIANGTPTITGNTLGTTVVDSLTGISTTTYSWVMATDELALRIADATADLSAGGSISILGVAALAPSLPTFDNNGTPSSAGLTSLSDRFGFYSAASSLNLLANGGITITYDKAFFSEVSVAPVTPTILPATVTGTSIAGDVTLDPTANSQLLMMPSPQGELGLFAGGNIVGTTIGMMDGDPGLLPGPFSSFSTPDGLVAQSGVIFGLPIVLSSTPDITLAQQYNKNPTHANDPEPIYLYAEGGIGSSERGVTLFASKQARIFAGQDIINMMFFGQNLNATDITRVVAGRDIIGTPQLLQPQAILANNAFGVVGTPEPAIEGNTFVIGGPGDFILEAGRNLGPFMPSVNVDSQYGTLISGEPANVSVQQSFGGGIISVGNQWNPYLPAAGASLTVMFGVGKGEDLNALRDTYVAPGTPAHALGGYSATLLSWMQQNAAAELMTEFGTTNVTVDQAYAAFVALPEVRQEVFLIRDVYFNELRATADTSSPSYKEYSRGYAAVNTLFPDSLGYSANNLTGGLGSSGALVTTGDLDLRLATIQTQQGGDINILGPGGRVVAGSTVATAAQAARRASDDARLYSGGVAPYGVPAAIESIPAGYEGVLTLRGGNIDTFTDSDFILNQSRLFTEQGGNILMWSSNGDLNAGQGPKTSANFPPIVVHVDQNGVVTVDQVGGVTGAGIASLQTTPDSPPGDVFLIAPRGTVDAGDAGVRVSGNLSVAALFVVNADNFKVQGATVGIPTVVGPNIGALTTASNATGAAAKTAEPPKSDGSRDTPSIIIVEVLGYGGESEQDSQPGEQQQRKRDGKQSYNLDSPVQVIGTGDLTTAQKKQLTVGEQQEYDSR